MWMWMNCYRIRRRTLYKDDIQDVPLYSLWTAQLFYYSAIWKYFGPHLLTLIIFYPVWINNDIPTQCGITLLNNSQSSAVTPLKFWNRQVFHPAIYDWWNHFQMMEFKLTHDNIEIRGLILYFPAFLNSAICPFSTSLYRSMLEHNQF